MTIDKAIERVHLRKPSAYSDEMKADWLMELDARIFGEIILRHEHTQEEIDQMDYPKEYPEDRDKPLLVPAPYDGLYERYLEAMIDYYNKEMALYGNSYEVFNEAFRAFSTHYTRTHMPLGVPYVSLP